MSEQLVDRPLRSVFVGNIPYEVTEEKLKEIFSEVGPVVSMKLVYDRETGKPKGYGFCEYKDIETAMSAMRNLNGFEINGRILRVDNAGAERHRMTEVSNQNAGGHNGPRHHNDNHEHHTFTAREPEGPPPPEKVPEVISKAVASLPPDQMFELMKQMKLCIQNNPNEARTMLLQNPQLAYALLQAQVVMKIIDPQTALSMLHKDNAIPVGTLMPEGQTGSMMMGPPSSGFGAPPASSQAENPWIAAGAAPPLMPINPPGPFGPGPDRNSMGNQNPNQGGDMDFRQMDPRLRNQTGPAPQDLDLRDPRAGPGPGHDRFPMDPRQRDRDLRDRDLRDRDMRSDRDQRMDRDLRDRDIRDREIRDPRLHGGPPQGNMPSDPRSRRDRVDREPPPPSSTASRAAASLPVGMGGLGPGATDTEKAALIMQVLQLSDEQIAMLPPEQRQSILVLKEQIAKSTSQGR